MNDSKIQKLQFNGFTIHVIYYNGAPHFLVTEVALALGYKDPKVLARKIGGVWSAEFLSTDAFKLQGRELADLKEVVSESDTTSGLADTTSPINKFAHHALLLSESGVNLACMKAQTAHGVSFRRWLATEVLPSIRNTGSYSLTQSSQSKSCPKNVAGATVILRALKAVFEIGRIDEDTFAEGCANVIEMASGVKCSRVRDAIHKSGGQPQGRQMSLFVSANDDQPRVLAPAQYKDAEDPAA